jgi:phosphoribosylformylglycinamidine (FGAM) synthase PurS component
VNLIDTREFFKIDVTDSKGHAKAELKEIARKLPAMERKMRRLGLDETIRVGVIMEMEKKPFETLTAREKLVLKTAHEWLALVWRQSRLKTWCSV